MGSCASVSSQSAVAGPADHRNGNRNAMYPVKSYDYQRRTTALVFPTVQKDLYPPEFNWSSSSEEDEAGSDMEGGGGAAHAETSDSDADLFSTLRPSQQREHSILPMNAASPDDAPLVQLHNGRPDTAHSRRNTGETSVTVKYLEDTLVPDPRDSRLRRSLREALDEHEEDRRAVHQASRPSSRPNSGSRRSAPRCAPPPLTLGVHKETEDDQYGEL